MLWKNLLYFLKTKPFLHFLIKSPALSGLFSKKFSLKKFIIFFLKNAWSEKVSYVFSKILLNFWKQKLRKNFYISGNRTFLYFRKWNVFILPEMELSYVRERYIQNLSIFRTTTIFRTLAYLEPWHIQSPGIFRTWDIFRTMSKNSYLALPIICYLIRILDTFDKLSGKKIFAHVEMK